MQIALRLNQAPRLWYDHCSVCVSKIGLKRSTASNCRFICDHPRQVYVLSYVNDLLILGMPDDVPSMRRKLKTLFATTQLGNCTNFLGVKFEEDQEGLYLTQSAYAMQLVAFCGFGMAKGRQTPLLLSHSMYDGVEPVKDDECGKLSRIRYRSLPGSLLFLSTRTLPDIATAVSLRAKHQTNYRQTHWRAINTVVRYLPTTTKYGIFIPKT